MIIRKKQRCDGCEQQLSAALFDDDSPYCPSCKALGTDREQDPGMLNGILDMAAQRPLTPAEADDLWGRTQRAARPEPLERRQVDLGGGAIADISVPPKWDDDMVRELLGYEPSERSGSVQPKAPAAKIDPPAPVRRKFKAEE